MNITTSNMSEYNCDMCGYPTFHVGFDFYGGKYTYKWTCDQYPWCKPLHTDEVGIRCDICRECVSSIYTVLHPTRALCRKFCGQCICEINGLNNTRGLLIIDQQGQSHTEKEFPHPDY